MLLARVRGDDLAKAEGRGWPLVLRQVVPVVSAYLICVGRCQKCGELSALVCVLSFLDLHFADFCVRVGSGLHSAKIAGPPQ